MARVDPAVTSFNSGEFSPRILGRVDIQKYSSGCEELQNFLIMPYGGITRRPGTYYAGEVKTSATKTRLIPFQFSTEQAYIIEMGNEYMRFYKDNGQIIVEAADVSDFDPTSTYTGGAGEYAKVGNYYSLDCGSSKYLYVSAPYGTDTTGKTVAVEIAADDNLAVTYVAGAITISLANTTAAKNKASLIQAALRLADASVDDWYVTENAAYAAARPVAGVTIAATSATAGDTIYLCSSDVNGNADNTSLFPPIATSYWTTQIAYEIETPYLEADLFEIQYVQSADVMYFVHPDYAPAKLSRTGHTSWTLEEIDYSTGTNRPALMDENTTATTITPSAATGNITLTASTAIFNSGHVGSIWKVNTGYVKITGYTNTTTVSGTVLYSGTTTGTSAYTEWSEGAWSDYRGYPRCVNFYEQRLFLAATEYQSQTVWGSQTADYENMEVGSDDSDGLSYTLASGQVNAIRWMIGGRGMALGTSGGIFVMSSGTNAEALTPTNVKVDLDTTYGSSTAIPKKIGNFVYYMQRNDRTLREFSYSWDIDSFVALDMTLLADHITESGVVEMDYQQSPFNILWCVRADGTIAALTRQLDQQVIGWSRIVTDGLFESVAVIPNGEEDQVWVVVNRTINGSTVRYVEYFKPVEFGDDQEDAYFVDCGLTYDSTPVSTVTGLGHLEGEEVQVLADGATHPNCTVSSGAITLDVSASVIHVGLAHDPVLLTLRSEGGSQIGTSQGKKKRINNVTIRMYRTLGIKIGSSDKQDDVYFRDSTMAMDEAVPLFTGDKMIHLPNGWEEGGQLYLTSDYPLPITVIAMFPRIDVSDF